MMSNSREPRFCSLEGVAEEDGENRNKKFYMAEDYNLEDITTGDEVESLKVGEIYHLCVGGQTVRVRLLKIYDERIMLVRASKYQ